MGRTSRAPWCGAGIGACARAAAHPVAAAAPGGGDPCRARPPSRARGPCTCRAHGTSPDRAWVRALRRAHAPPTPALALLPAAAASPCGGTFTEGLGQAMHVATIGGRR